MGESTKGRLLRTCALVASVALVSSSPGVAQTHQSVAVLRVLVPTVSDGPFWFHNQLIQKGAAVAVREIAAGKGIDGRVRIKLVRVPAGAGAGARRAIARAKAHGGLQAVLLPCNTDSQLPWARAASRARLLALAPCDPDPRASAGLRMYWPVGMSGNAEAAQLVGYAARNYASTAFLVDAKQPRYARVMSRYLRAAAGLYKVRLVGSATLAATGSNSQAVAKRIAKLQPRAVLTSLSSPEVWTFIRTLRKHGYVRPVYGTDGMDANIAHDNRTAEAQDRSVYKYVYFASFGFARPTGSRFRADYKDTYKDLPLGSYPGLGFETIQVLRAAVAKARSVEPSRLDRALASGLRLTGITLEDIVYPGHGQHRPLAHVGLVTIVRGVYFPMLSSVPTAPIPRV